LKNIAKDKYCKGNTLNGRFSAKVTSDLIGNVNLHTIFNEVTN